MTALSRDHSILSGSRGKSNGEFRPAGLSVKATDGQWMVEDLLDDAGRWSESMAERDRQALRDRLSRARELIGPIDLLEDLREWLAPEER